VASTGGITISRRAAFGVAAAAASTAVPTVAHAAEATSTVEAVRRGASRLPGYGPTDVFYPASWQGTWKMRRQVSYGGTGGDSPEKTIQLDYAVRFVPSIQDGAVVADRGWNQANLEAALRQDATAVRSYTWTETNPNDLFLVLRDGTTKAIKVTKRATTDTTDTDADEGDNVQSSEFQRVVIDRSGSNEGTMTTAVPEVSARRVLTKWKRNADGNLEGLEIVYDVGSSGGSDGTSILSKSRLFLEQY